MASFPFEFNIHHLTVRAHLIFELLAFTVGFRYFLFLRRRQADPFSDSARLWILTGGAVGAFVFSRFIGALENPNAWVSADNPILYAYANKTMVGGLLGGLLMVEATKRWMGETRSTGDLLVYPLILALIIGRIGCFSNGVYEETYGEPTRFFAGMDLGDGIRRHPVTLYEIAFLLALWVVLRRLQKSYVFQSGYPFRFFMIAYLTFRFLLDFIKPGVTFFLGLGTIQLACLAGLVYYRHTILALFTNPVGTISIPDEH